MTPEDLKGLIKKTTARNGSLSVTGLLLYSSGNFMQLLEGPDGVVGDLYDVIGRDARHTDVRELLFKPVAGRLFPRWKMGLLNLDVDQRLDERRLSDVLNDSSPSPNIPFGTDGSLAALREFRRQVPAMR